MPTYFPRHLRQNKRDKTKQVYLLCVGNHAISENLGNSQILTLKLIASIFPMVPAIFLQCITLSSVNVIGYSPLCPATHDLLLLPCWYDRGWDGWMASLTQWTWIWVDSGCWRWTGRPGMLWFMGSLRVWHDWATELNWNTCALAEFELATPFIPQWLFSYSLGN